MQIYQTMGGNFFEGAEKLLEVWYDYSPTSLRSITRCEWDQILESVGARIISHNQNEHFDSYVLSESSLFVFDDRYIIKTCGVTVLLIAFQEIDKIVQRYDKRHLSGLFYSHKGFLRPDDQKYPHQNYFDEENYLNTIISSGKMINFSCNDELISSWGIYAFIDSKFNLEISDITVEIMMYGLSSSCFKTFSRDSYIDPDKEMGIKSGISDIIPGSSIHDVSFDPYGYSVNGCRNDAYFTIHVTPQPECSYASFETNLHSFELIEACYRSLKIFSPKNFCLTIISTSDLKFLTKRLISEMKYSFGIKYMSTKKKSPYRFTYAWL